MMCSNCGKHEANFIYTESINGVKKEIRLCNKCADKLGFLDMSINMPNLDFSNFFGDFLNEYDSLMPSIFSERPRILKCLECGTDYDEFLNTGRFGCSNCYDIFQEKIEPLLKQLHGDTKYLGKKSGNNFKKMEIKDTKTDFATSKNSNKIDILKEELKQAIKVENYEKAAEIRDKIKELEEKEVKQNTVKENKKDGNIKRSKPKAKEQTENNLEDNDKKKGAE